MTSFKNFLKTVIEINKMKTVPLKKHHLIKKELRKVNIKNWEKYAFVKVSTQDPYSKKIVYDKNNLQVAFINFKPNSESHIHNHPEVNSCIIKCLRGEFKEIKYKDKNGFEPTSTDVILENDVSSVNDNKIFHKIINLSYAKSNTLNIYLK